MPATLWCLIYTLLASRHGSKCRLLVPANTGTRIYLKSTGLFRLLQKSGVAVDDGGIESSDDQQMVLPLTYFDSESQIDALTNQIYETLEESGLGAANIRPLVSEVFVELAMNAVYHSELPVGAFAAVQFHDSGDGPRFLCVADGGIGIYKSLERNPDLRGLFHNDLEAILTAIADLVSSLPDPTRGIGLHWVSEGMRLMERQFILHSGLGMLKIKGASDSPEPRSNPFPGTLAFVSIPT